MIENQLNPPNTPATTVGILVDTFVFATLRMRPVAQINGDEQGVPNHLWFDIVARILMERRRRDHDTTTPRQRRGHNLYDVWVE